MKKETNYEHYKDEIINAMIHGLECDFKRLYILKSSDCGYNNEDCTTCDKKALEWFNAPYEEPKIEIDWEKVPEDTPVYVSDTEEFPDENNFLRHFSAYFKDNDRPFEVWAHGKTSFTTSNVFTFKYCSLARKEDIEKYRKV